MKRHLQPVDDVRTQAPAGAAGDRRQATLVASLRLRYELADQRRDADAKLALFKEAVYLGIRPEAYQGRTSAA